MAQRQEWGIEISKAELNRLLIEEQDDFHEEKAEVLSAGLAEIWALYQQLKHYKLAPGTEFTQIIKKTFDELVSRSTCYEPLNKQ